MRPWPRGRTSSLGSTVRGDSGPEVGETGRRMRLLRDHDSQTFPTRTSRDGLISKKRILSPWMRSEPLGGGGPLGRVDTARPVPRRGLHRHPPGHGRHNRGGSPPGRTGWRAERRGWRLRREGGGGGQRGGTGRGRGEGAGACACVSARVRACTGLCHWRARLRSAPRLGLKRGPDAWGTADLPGPARTSHAPAALGFGAFPAVSGRPRPADPEDEGECPVGDPAGCSC